MIFLPLSILKDRIFFFWFSSTLPCFSIQSSLLWLMISLDVKSHFFFVKDVCTWAILSMYCCSLLKSYKKVCKKYRSYLSRNSLSNLQRKPLTKNSIHIPWKANYITIHSSSPSSIIWKTKIEVKLEFDFTFVFIIHSFTRVAKFILGFHPGAFRSDFL